MTSRADGSLQVKDRGSQTPRTDRTRPRIISIGPAQPVVTSDAGLLAYRELDDALGLTTVAGEMLADARTGTNGHHALVGLFRQSVFGRLAGYGSLPQRPRR
jgi:Transposase DDE domain group 1